MNPLDPRPALIAMEASQFRDNLLLRGWSHPKAMRFAKAWAKRRMNGRMRIVHFNPMANPLTLAL